MSHVVLRIIKLLYQVLDTLYLGSSHHTSFVNAAALYLESVKTSLQQIYKCQQIYVKKSRTIYLNMLGAYHLVNLNEYWPAIGNLVCVLAYDW